MSAQSYSFMVINALLQIARGYALSEESIQSQTGLNINFVKQSQGLGFYPHDEHVIALLKILDKKGFYQREELRFIEEALYYYYNNIEQANVWLMLMLNQATFQDFIDCAIRIANTNFRNNHMELMVAKGKAYIKHHYTTAESHFNSAQGALTAIHLGISHFITYLQLEPEFFFSGEHIQDETNFIRINGHRLHYQQGFDAIAFDADLLKRKNPNYCQLNKKLAERLESLLSLEANKEEASLEDKINARLQFYFNSDPQSMDSKQMCHDLHMSPATMQRRLHQQNTSFKTLLDDFRKKQSLSLMQSANCNLTQVSESLGYANVSSFNRAFKRWFDMSPRQYKQYAQQNELGRPPQRS